MVALMALLAVVIDGSLVKRQRRITQNAADAGALAGAQEIFRNQIQDTVFSSAINETARNGFTNGSNHARVVVDTPTSGTYVGSKYVRVQVWDTVPTILAGIVGRTGVVVRSLAIGGIIPPSGDCIVSLDPSHAQTLKVTASARVNAPGCGIKDNSTDPDDALFVQAGATLDATGGSIKVTGGSSGTTTPAAQTGVTPTPDPLAYLTMPAFSHTCTFTGFNVNSTQTLNPGTYCGGINVQGAGTIARFGEGDYYLLGGGLIIQSSARAVSTGTGSTFINTWDGGGPTHAYGRVNISSSSVDTLYANTGPGAALSGVLFFQDRTVTGTAGLLPSQANQIQSGNNSVLTGSIYFSTQDLEIHGSTMTLHGGIVARQIFIHDAATVVNISSIGAGTGYFRLKRPSVVQ
jgi:hypothetical protein